MPNYAYLDTELKCPFCNAVVADRLGFQWGFCPGYVPRPELIYRIGDKIKWHRLSNNSIPSWTHFKGNGSNIGDPDFKNLFIQEEFFLDWNNSIYQKECSFCKTKIEGAIIEIRNEYLLRAWIYQQGDFDHTISYFVVQEDSSVQPMPDWDNHLMSLAEG